MKSNSYLIKAFQGNSVNQGFSTSPFKCCISDIPQTCK